MSTNLNNTLLSLSNRFCRNARISQSRGSKEGALRKAGRHLGVWSYSVYSSGRLSTILGRGSASIICTDQKRILRRKFVTCRIASNFIYVYVEHESARINCVHKLFRHVYQFRKMRASTTQLRLTQFVPVKTSFKWQTRSWIFEFMPTCINWHSN